MVTEEDLIRTVADGVLPRLAAGEALLHVRPPDRDRRGRARDRRPGQEGDRQGPRGLRPQRHPLHRLDRRVRAQAAHAVPVGRAARPRDHRRPAARSCATPSARTSSTAARSASATTTASPASSRDCCPAATAGSARSSSRCGATAAGSTAGASTSPTTAGSPRAEKALAGTGVDLDWYTTRERDYDEVLPWDHLDSGLDKDWLWADWEDALAVADGTRRRGRGLPLDALLRLRRLPGDGHRDPDRPHRPAAAAAVSVCV